MGEGGVHGRTINLIGCGASGVYAPGPDEEEEKLAASFFRVCDFFPKDKSSKILQKKK